MKLLEIIKTKKKSMQTMQGKCVYDKKKYIRCKGYIFVRRESNLS